MFHVYLYSINRIHIIYSIYSIYFFVNGHTHLHKNRRTLSLLHNETTDPSVNVREPANKPCSNSYSYILIHIIIFWFMFLYSESCSYILIHVLIFRFIFSYSDSCSYTLIHIIIFWFMFLYSESCSYILIHFTKFWILSSKSGSLSHILIFWLIFNPSVNVREPANKTTLTYTFVLGGKPNNSFPHITHYHIFKCTVLWIFQSVTTPFLWTF